MTTKANEGPERVRVWHPEYRAEANPRRVELKKWTEKGWKVQPAAQKETDK